MKNRLTALLLAAALAFAIGVNAVSPEDAATTPAPAQTDAAEPADTVETAAEPADTAAEPAETAQPVPAVTDGTLEFSALRGQMLSHYYPLLALGENIQTLEEWDYARTEDDLRDALNAIAAQQWELSVMPTIDLDSLEGLTPEEIFDQVGGSAISAAAGLAVSPVVLPQLQTQYDACLQAFEDVRSGKMQADNAGVVRQLRNLQNQTVIVAESLFITYKGLEAQDASLSRTVAALERTEREMTLRRELGQISELTLQQVRSGGAQAQSGQKTLRMNMDNLLLQLKAMTGAKLDGSLALGALPQVSAQQLADMDLDADYAKAAAASYELYDAKKSYDAAETAFQEARDKYADDPGKNEWLQAQHTWNAAQYTYENAKQSFELKFRTLYAQVRDAAQTAQTRRASLGAQEKAYAAAALRYEQGTLSANALADAKDTLASAKAEAASAERDLFAQYRSYCWAVEYGILNA